MKNNERAPALIIAVALIIGIISGMYFSPSIAFCLSLSIAFFSISIFFYIRKNQFLFSVLIVMSFLIIGLLRYEIHSRMFPEDSIVNLKRDQEYILEGVVANQPEESSRYTKFILNIESFKTKSSDIFSSATGKVMAYYYGDIPLEYGDKVIVRSELPLPGEATNFYGFDYRKYLNRNGIYRVAFIFEGELEKQDISEGDPLYKFIVYPIRSHIEYVISNTLRGDISGFLEGILLGGGKKMASKTHEKFVDVGVVHILAVSGLHVGIIALLFYAMFQTLLHFNKKWTTLLTIVVLILYVIITQMRPSVMRASLMISIVLSGQVFGRKPRLLNSMGIAAIVLLAINPGQMMDLGFQLSFGATFGIVYLYPRLFEMFPQKWQNSRSFFSIFGFQAGLISICAQLGTFPIIAMNFHRIPLLAIFANLLIVPVIALAVSLGILSVIGGVFSIGLARIFSAANWIILKYVMLIVDFFAQFKFASIAFPHLGLWFIVFFYALVITGVNIKRSQLSRKVFIGLLLLIPMFYGGYLLLKPKDEMWVVFLDVGQGDSIYIKYPNGRTMLIDAGYSHCFDYVIEPFVMAQGRKSIDEVLITHAHYDHFGGFVPFYEKMYADEFLASFAKRRGMLYNHLLDQAIESSARFDTIRAGDTLTDVYPAHGLFLWPDSTVIDDNGNTNTPANDLSAILLIRYGEAEFMFSGDAEEDVEHLIVERFGDSIDVDVYKAAHHGSNTSNSAAFLRNLKPSMIVVSVGRRNKFNHPDSSTIARFDSLGCLLYRTDEDGAVWIKTDGKMIWGRTKQGSKFRFSALQ